MRNYSIELKENKLSYQYNRHSPLIRGNHFQRAYQASEMTRIVEMTESAQNPSTTNAQNIPVFLFFDSPNSEPAQPDINIPKEMNKYYCRLQAHNDGSGNYPNTPQALGNCIYLHALLAIRNLKATNHLPFTIVYQAGMNDNHAVDIAVRITSFDDPGKNEIMLINPLPGNGYQKGEEAAVNALCLAMRNEAVHRNSPKIIALTPRTTGIQQSTSDMKASCAGIAASMACEISPNASFFEQKDYLISHMKSICGHENEATLRHKHQSLLSLPHPLDPRFNPTEVKAVLNVSKNSDVPLFKPKTPDEAIHALYTNPERITDFIKALEKKRESLFKICSLVKDKHIIKNMFMNPQLMEALKQEGQVEALRKVHAEIYESMWPDYSNKIKDNNLPIPGDSPRAYVKHRRNSYEHYVDRQDLGRNPDSDVTADSCHVIYKSKYSKQKGDFLKSNILNDFCEALDKAFCETDIDNIVNKFKSDGRYAVLAQAQGLTSQVLGLTTSSVKAFEQIIETRKAELNNSQDASKKI